MSGTDMADNATRGIDFGGGAGSSDQVVVGPASAERRARGYFRMRSSPRSSIARDMPCPVLA
eukprot:424106-Rhodomonas_salina.3